MSTVAVTHAHTLHEMHHETNTSRSLLFTDPHIKVCGKLTDVARAKELTMRVLDTKCTRVTLKMDVSHTEHSHVIGKGDEGRVCDGVYSPPRFTQMLVCLWFGWYCCTPRIHSCQLIHDYYTTRCIL